MRNFPDWLQAYMSYTRFSESPDSFHLYTGISTIAGALQRKVWNDQYHFKWTPNFYIFLIAPPGIVSKTTTAEIGYDLLKEIPGTYIGPQSTTWQALVHRMADSSTTTDMGDTLFTHSSMSIIANELGTFFTPSDDGLVDALVSLWDAKNGNWERDIKKGGATITNPWLNIIGCSTTSWVRKNLNEYFIGGGMSSRSLFIYADKKRLYDALPGRTARQSRTDRSEFRRKLIEDLGDIAEMAGEFTFTPNAETWMDAWYTELWSPHNIMRYQQNRLGDYLARRQTHLVKMAMVLSAAESSSRFIDVPHLVRSESLLGGAERDMTYLFSMIGMAELSTFANEIVALVRATGDGVLKDVVWRWMMNQIGDYQVFEKALLSAIRAGILDIIITSKGPVIYPKGEELSPHSESPQDTAAQDS